MNGVLGQAVGFDSASKKFHVYLSNGAVGGPDL